jgi:PAS domain S-box-containing protein
LNIVQNLYSINIGILLFCLFSALGLVVKNIERKYNIYYVFLVAIVIGSFVAAIFQQNSNISISHYTFWQKIYNSFLILEAVSLILLISELTGFKAPRIRSLLMVPVAVFFVINPFRPFGLYFDNISAINLIRLPFGITYNTPDKVNSIYISIVSVYVLIFLIFVIYSLRFAFKNNRKGNAVLVISSFLPVILLLLIANFFYQSNKDISGFGDLIYDFSLFFLAVSIGFKNFRDVLRSGNIANSLRKSEESYRLLFENMEEGFTLNLIITGNSGKAVDFRFLDANTAFENLIGFKRIDFIGKTYRDLFPDLNPSRIENYGLVTLKGLPYKEEFYSDAIKKYLRVRAFYHHKDHFAVMYEDITEQKIAEASLRNSEKQFSDLMAALPDIVFIHKDGKIIYANQTAITFSGYPLDELVGANIINFIAPEYRDIIIQNIQLRNAGEEIDDFECNFILKSGVVRTYIVRGTNTLYNNEPVALTILFDITDRLEAEKKLRESEQKFKALSDSTPVAILVYQYDKFIYANPAAESMSGYSNEELIGMNYWHIVAPEYLQPLKERGLKRQSGEKLSPIIDFKVITKSGSVKWASLAGSQIVFSGQPAVLLSVIDISERKNIENALRESEQMYRQVNERLSKINAEKDKMFSIISHDLRGPFHGILGLTNILMDVNLQVSYQDIRTMSRNLHESATKIYELIENLLEWSRLQQGVVLFNPVLLNLAALIDKNINTLNGLALRKEINVINNISSSFNILADEEMVNIVIRNLLSNALKFSYRKGSISFSAAESENGFIQISVIDSGVGISEYFLEKLFRIDEKVSKKGTEGEPSTGLGLILCKEFVEKNNGKIWAESIENSGSTFYFTIPKSPDN